MKHLFGQPDRVAILLIVNRLLIYKRGIRLLKCPDLDWGVHLWT